MRRRCLPPTRTARRRTMAAIEHVAAILAILALLLLWWAS